MLKDLGLSFICRSPDSKGEEMKKKNFWEKNSKKVGSFVATYLNVILAAPHSN